MHCSKVKPREQRERRAPTAFSPTAGTSPRKSRKPKDSIPETDGKLNPSTAAKVTPARPEHKRLENKVKSQVRLMDPGGLY